MTPDTLANIHAACFKTPRPWSVQEFQSLLAQSNICLFTDPQGFLLIRDLPPQAEILTIAVMPDARRQGIASRLLNEAFETIASKQLFLEVAASNQTAISFYKNMGFQETGRRPNYYKHPDGTREDALLFAR